MNYQVYKLVFQSAVHFGKNSLEDGEYTFCADTLFSALYQEAIRSSKDTADCLLNAVKSGELILSDAFPFIGKTYFLPKPMMRIESENNQGNSVIKKAYKKLKYIPVDEIDNYLKGQYDVLNAPDFDELGQFQMKVSASIRGEEETVPYRVGQYYFREGSGLYLIFGYHQDSMLNMVEELLEMLSYSGIGGKRASGLGRFELYRGEMHSALLRRLQGNGRRYMTLSVSLPREDELETAIENASYLLCKRSGFVASDNYADSQTRKKDLYTFKAGSCFEKQFAGDIVDVSDAKGRHAVYRYAKPMFMEADA